MQDTAKYIHFQECLAKRRAAAKKGCPTPVQILVMNLGTKIGACTRDLKQINPVPITASDSLTPVLTYPLESATKACSPTGLKLAMFAEVQV